MGASGWVVETGISAAGGGASDGERLFFGGREGSLVAVDPAGERWRASLPGPVIGHPVVNGSQVLCAYAAAAGHSGGISLHDTATGKEVWRWGAGFEPAAPPAWGAAVLVPDMGGVLRALDPADGSELWHTNGQTAYSTTPVATPLSVFAVEVTGRVSRLDPDDGGEVWITDLASAATGTPVVVGETLVVGLANGSIVGLGTPLETP
ncbi:MAG: PQQ-binding-like beta-propeller repeat protein [Myxococcota bacterium]|nr:PQQ-binding-like beta-propeller repeat protein [Myxococcota bacterium]